MIILLHCLRYAPHVLSIWHSVVLPSERISNIYRSLKLADHLYTVMSCHVSLPWRHLDDLVSCSLKTAGDNPKIAIGNKNILDNLLKHVPAAYEIARTDVWQSSLDSDWSRFFTGFRYQRYTHSQSSYRVRSCQWRKQDNPVFLSEPLFSTNDQWPL